MVRKSDNQGVKEETFIQTGRRGGGGQPEGRGIMARWQIVDQAVPHSRADKLGGTTGEQDRPRNPEFQHGEIKPQTSDWKYLWGLRRQWEKLSASQESLLERPTGSYNVHKPTHWESAPERPNCLWVAGEVTENQQRVEQAALFPLRPFPTYSITTQQRGLPCPGEHLRPHPILCNRCAKDRKKKMTQMKEQIKAPEKNTTKRQWYSQTIRCTVQKHWLSGCSRNSLGTSTA